MVNDHPGASAKQKKRKKASKRGSTTGRALVGREPPTVIGLQPMLKRYDVFKKAAVAVAPRAESPSSAGQDVPQPPRYLSPQVRPSQGNPPSAAYAHYFGPASPVYVPRGRLLQGTSDSRHRKKSR